MKLKTLKKLNKFFKPKKVSKKQSEKNLLLANVMKYTFAIFALLLIYDICFFAKTISIIIIDIIGIIIFLKFSIEISNRIKENRTLNHFEKLIKRRR